MFSVRKIVNFVAGPRLFFFALFWLMILLVLGTIAQRDIGLFAAQEKYFSSWFLWVGNSIPLPGGGMVMSLITLCLATKLALQKWRLENLGTLTTHIGALTLLLGGFATALLSEEGTMMLKEAEQKNYMVNVEAGIMPPPRTELPFALTLIDFNRETYAGTNKASSYSSKVVVVDHDLNWPVTISMNHPLRYKGYTFYQSSFENDGGDEISILQVVKNPAKLFPYIASSIMCLGLLIHLFQRLPKLMRRGA